MAIIHAHIARLPVPPHQLNPDVPVPVSDIVMKLLSKPAEERYQNSFGLAADLQECLHRLRMTGRIDPFVLGSRDISLRFIIPQSLVGRDAELDTLYAAFDRVSRGDVEVILVTGEPGIGKSALINEIHKPIVGKRGYFIAGKFDQFHRVVPYSAIIQAFQSLARQLLTESDEHLGLWKEKLLAALGPNGKMITDAITEIELIIGKQPDVPELGPEETQNRFNLFFKNFVRVFADERHPLVLFLDDLHWADQASLRLLQTLTTDRDLRHMLFIGTYRDTEVAAHHPLMITLDAVGAAGLPINTLHLGALGPEDINQLISSFLRCSSDASVSLAQTIHAKTKGSPFFVNQFLKTLYDRHHITLDLTRGWTWDLQTIRELQVTDNVVQFMADKLHQLSAAPLELLKLCACIGNRFDLETLASVTRRSLGEVLSIIDTLMQDGLINRVGDLYRFHHDRIQEAAYSLLAQEEREHFHYQIGNLDLRRTPAGQLSKRVFYICDQLNQAHRLVSSREAERAFLAQLNLKAGIKAKDSAAYAAAVSYLVMGNMLLAKDAWQSDYDLAYALHSELMECQYLNRNLEEAEKLFDIIIAQALTKKDKAKAYNTMVVLYTNMRSPRDAVDLGLKALALFDIHISPDVGVASLLIELLQVRHLLSGRTVEQIIDLPLMANEETIACTQLLYSVGTPAYYVNQNLFARLVFKEIKMGLKAGCNTPYSSAGIIAAATIIQTGLGDYPLGYRLGEMALKLNERIDNHKTAGMVHHVFAFFIQHWKRHARHNLEIYRKAYQLSVNAGDFIYAGHSINAAADCRLMIGMRLDDILEENNKYKDFMPIIKDPFIAARYRENNQMILTLKGRTANRHALSESGYDEDAYIRQLGKEKNIFGLCYTLLYREKLLYLYGRYDEARLAAAELDKHIKVQVGTQLVAEHCFYYGLILTALIRGGGSPRRLMDRAVLRRNQRKMRTWAALCPENFRHKYDLVTAEMMALKGRYLEAQALYHAAIEGARLNDYLHEEALACERLALLYAGGHNQDEARVFMQRALQCYTAWGATAKTEDLQERYPGLLGEEPKTGPADTFSKTTASETVSRTLDLSTVMQVSQVISSEIRLERLLQQTMHMAITNAGAQRGYLILASDGPLRIQASEDVDTGENQVLQAIELDQCDGLSPAIVHYVHRSGEPLILGDAGREGAFTNDPYVIKNRCKSILCLPIMNKGMLAGILYMENNLTADAFTPDRLEILRIISAQAAISLQNAQLYENISMEITVRKQAEEALQISEVKYRTILEEMQDVYSETNLEGVLTFVNPATCAVTGYTQDELLGLDIKKLSVPEEREDLESYYQAVALTGLPGSPLTSTLLGKNGITICLEIMVSLIRNKSGDVIGFRNLGRDITVRKRLENDLLESYKKVQEARVATILGLAKLAEYRDEATGAHLERIREYARIITQELSTKREYQGYITPEYIEDIFNSAILHDIGKVGVPDAILLKPGKLTKDEFEVIKTHATLGGDALRDVEAKIEGQSFLTLGKEIAYYHHEKWDGTGYPKGMRGEAIPLSARIVALADVYDALTSKRTYKDAFPHQQAMEIIVKDRGTHFAPDVVDAFVTHAEDFRRIREELLGK